MTDAPALEGLGMAMTDFIRAYDEQPFEMIDGERIVRVPTVLRHQLLLRQIRQRLEDFAEPHGLGVVMSEMPFVLTYAPDWVSGSRVPDIMFYQQDRWLAYQTATPNYEDLPMVLVPDLAVEILSKHDQNADVLDKVTTYLKDGVLAVWLFNPFKRRVYVYTAQDDLTMVLSDGDTLDGGDLLPGFQIDVTTIFGNREES